MMLGSRTEKRDGERDRVLPFPLREGEQHSFSFPHSTTSFPNSAVGHGTGHPMNDADVATLVRDGMLVVLKIGGPLLAVALASGLLVALVQAITQINEATLAFIPKLLAIGITLILLGPFMFATLSSYTVMLFDRMIAVGGS